jgi:AcrR family transcriptional regulator
MAKGIDREQIIDVTLDLVRLQENVHNVNWREIARNLGCAHTNLYNYYKDLDQIYWDALDIILAKLEVCLTSDLSQYADGNSRLIAFYTRFFDFYVDNPGWFRLVWLEKLDGARPQKNVDLTNQTVSGFTSILISLLAEQYDLSLSHNQAKYILHTVHCYLHGEISIYISGRGLIKVQDEFKQHVIAECVHLTGLLALGLKNGKPDGLHPSFAE